MPITQERMRNVLDEAHSRNVWMGQFLADLQRLMTLDISVQSRFEALVLHIKNMPEAPSTPHTERERERLERNWERNVRGAQRMQRKRAEKTVKETEELFRSSYEVKGAVTARDFLPPRKEESEK